MYGRMYLGLCMQAYGGRPVDVWYNTEAGGSLTPGPEPQLALVLVNESMLLASWGKPTAVPATPALGYNNVGEDGRLRRRGRKACICRSKTILHRWSGW